MQGALRTKGKYPDTAEVQLLKPALLDNGLRGDVSQRRLGRGEADSEYERFVLRQCQREEHGVVPHGVSAARRHIAADLLADHRCIFCGGIEKHSLANLT